MKKIHPFLYRAYRFRHFVNKLPTPNKTIMSIFAVCGISAVLLSLLLMSSNIPEKSVIFSCGSSFWANHLELWKTVGVDYNDDFDKTFGTNYFNPKITLAEAINKTGPGLNHLARSGTAAYLNALHDPKMDATKVKDAVYFGYMDLLDGYNTNCEKTLKKH